MPSAIPYVEKVWEVTSGCTAVSEGCAVCGNKRGIPVSQEAQP